MVRERVDCHRYLASREWALKKEAVREWGYENGARLVVPIAEGIWYHCMSY
jgi:hypothetical protein